MKKLFLAILFAPALFAQQSGMPPSVPGTSGHCPNITSTNSLADSGSQCGNVTAIELQNGTYRYEVDTGAANAYVIAPSPSVSSYVAGLTLSFKVANANTGASTINVSGLGTKTIFKGGATNLASGDFPAGSIQTVIYDGAAFQAQSVNAAPGAQTIASGTSALGTSAISTGACATVVTTTGTGVATTDVVGWGFNADPTSTTGYSPTANGMLTIIAYPTANNVNFKVCNNTAASVTPGAVTLNWRVVR